MSSLYFLPYEELLGLTVLLCIGILLQGYCVAYGCFYSCYQIRNLAGALTDAGVLLYQLVLLFYGANTCFNVNEGYMVLQNKEMLLLFLYFLLMGLCILRCCMDRTPRYLATVLLAGFSLPWAEMFFGDFYPWLLMIAAVLWILRGCIYLRFYQQERKEHLSAFSVKEAVDTMDFGILFCKGRGDSQGQILLSNRKMQDLMYTLTGGLLYSGKVFYEMLQEGQTLSGCHRREETPQLVYELQDGTVWRFEQESLTIRGGEFTLLSASDITKYSWTLDQLMQQNGELEMRNQELKTMLENMESICRTEQTLQAKSRVHDLLGQRISMILRSVREHREPDEALLQTFAEGLTDELKADSADYAASLQMAAESFKSIGVTVILEGKMPEDQQIQKVFFEISAEAMTNAVRHGYAEEIHIIFSKENGGWILKVQDNGTVKELPILEGGGLRGMRRKAEELGGQFSYCTTSHFAILVSIPEGEDL